jgi:anthranilate phosphoribosyltransferase
LLALRVKGETVEEITAAARVVRSKALAVTAPAGAMDIVGTGGDGTGTYNVSTCTAFVVAGCGVKVAKHGNRAISSKSGAGDVLAALGVKLDVSPEVIARAIAEAGVGFMFAPAHHVSFKHVGPTRSELGTRTVFNLLGPLCNPAGVKKILLGVYAKSWVEPLAHVLKALGTTDAWVVHGSDGADEITTTGSTTVAELKNGRIRLFELVPETAGLARCQPADLVGGDAAHNAQALREVLDGRPSAYRDIVLLNAAAALTIAGVAGDLPDGMRAAAAAIGTGAAARALDTLIAITNG